MLHSVLLMFSFSWINSKVVCLIRLWQCHEELIIIPHWLITGLFPSDSVFFRIKYRQLLKFWTSCTNIDSFSTTIILKAKNWQKRLISIKLSINDWRLYGDYLIFFVANWKFQCEKCNLIWPQYTCTLKDKYNYCTL